MTEPQVPAIDGDITTEVYQVNAGWYLEIVIPHPNNPEMPRQSMTIKCDNEWWARFLAYTLDDIVDTQYIEEFSKNAPTFRYEG